LVVLDVILSNNLRIAVRGSECRAGVTDVLGSTEDTEQEFAGIKGRNGKVLW
jgi:hypothetical protein